MKIWPVIVVVILISLIQMITGKFSHRTLFGVALLVLLGAIIPPFALGIGILALLYLAMKDSKPIMAWLQDKMGGKKQ